MIQKIWCYQKIYKTLGRLSEVADYYTESSSYTIQTGENSSTLFGQVARSSNLPVMNEIDNYARTNTTVVVNSESVPIDDEITIIPEPEVEEVKQKCLERKKKKK